MKIHGTAKGAALSTKDFGVAFGSPSEPIAFDAEAEEDTKTSGTDEQIPNFTVADNSNRILIAVAVRYDNSQVGNVSEITWNTDEEFESAIVNDNDYGISEIWYLVNPTATTANIDCTWDATTTHRGIGVYSFYNVNQSSPIGSSPTDEGVSIATTGQIIPATTGSIIVDCNVSSSNAAALTQTQTLGWRVLIADDDRSFSSQYALEPDIGSANNMYYTYANLKSWTWCGVEVKQV